MLVTEYIRTCLRRICMSAADDKSSTMCLSTADSRASSWRNSKWHLATSGKRSPSICRVITWRFSAESICSMFARPASETFQHDLNELKWLDAHIARCFDRAVQSQRAATRVTAADVILGSIWAPFCRQHAAKVACWPWDMTSYTNIHSRTRDQKKISLTNICYLLPSLIENEKNDIEKLIEGVWNENAKFYTNVRKRHERTPPRKKQWCNQC